MNVKNTLKTFITWECTTDLQVSEVCEFVWQILESEGFLEEIQKVVVKFLESKTPDREKVYFLLDINVNMSIEDIVLLRNTRLQDDTRELHKRTGGVM